MANPNLPFLITGTVSDLDGNSRSGASVTFKNSNTSDVLGPVLTNSNGVYLVDIANFVNGYTVGDSVVVTASFATQGEASETLVIPASSGGSTVDVSLVLSDDKPFELASSYQLVKSVLSSPDGKAYGIDYGQPVNLQVGDADVSDSNPVPVSDAGSSLTVDGVPELIVTNAIDSTSFDLNAAAFSVASSISNDYTLNSIKLNFSTAESKTITLTGPDGTVLYQDTNINQNVSLEDINISFNASENFTVAVTQFSSAGTMDCVAVVTEGSSTLGGNAVLGAGTETIGDVGLVNQGFISTNNSSTATLTGDAVFTGIGDDVSQFASVSILYKSDVAAAASGLKIEFSQDNINWDVSLVGDLGAKTFQVHRLVPAAKFFRVVYTNGSVAQSSFRLQCIFHKSSSPVLITRAGQPQSTVDATPTRQTAHIDLDFARKHIPGGRSFFFFGNNDTVGNTYEDIHPDSGDINWLTTAGTVEVLSTNAADTSAGLGVRQVELHGLSATGADQDEVITMNGTTPVVSSLTYIRVNKLHNENVGTYGGSHQGNVTCRVTGGGVTLSVMKGEEGLVDSGVQYGLGEASNGYWTVPLGKVLYITDVTVNVQSSGNNTGDVILYEREGILNVSAPFDPRRIIWNRFDIQGEHREVFKSHIKIKQLTDLFFRARSSSSTVRIDVKLHFYLVDEDASGA